MHCWKFCFYNLQFKIFKYFNVTIRKIQSFAKCNNMYIHYSNSKMKNACTVHIEILFYGWRQLQAWKCLQLFFHIFFLRTIYGWLAINFTRIFILSEDMIEDFISFFFIIMLGFNYSIMLKKGKNSRFWIFIIFKWQKIANFMIVVIKSL